MRYILGDLHGCGLELQELIKKINPKPEDKIILAGDLFDRGMHGHIVWDLIHTYKMDCVVGNHERKMVGFLTRNKDIGRSSLPPHYIWALKNLYMHGVSKDKVKNFI